MKKASAQKVSVLKEVFDEDIIFATHRLATFNGWPYNDENCTAVKMARAGFYFTGVDEEPVGTCAFCLKQLVFDATDEPWDEHMAHSPQCKFVQLGPKDDNTLTVEELLVLVLERRISKFRVWCNSTTDKFNEVTADLVEVLLPAMKVTSDAEDADVKEKTAAS